MTIQADGHGISKKCLGIIDAFKEIYDIVDVVDLSENGIRFNSKEIHSDKSKLKFIQRFKYFLYQFIGHYKPISKIIGTKKYDALYFRFHYFVTPGMLSFFKKLKQKNDSIKIFLEIPTYPFIDEVKGRKIEWVYWANKHLYEKLKNVVNKIVTYSDDEEIYGIETLRISNGFFNLTETETKSVTVYPQPITNVIKLGMVANFSFWHAADILIETVIKYYKTHNGHPPIMVEVHFFGDGDLELCQKMIHDSNLNKQFVFHGRRSFAEISQASESIHLMMGTLGYHRKNLDLGSCLKNREYAYMGMPMVLKTKDNGLPKDLPYVLYFSDDASLLDIDKMVEFYNELRHNYPTYKASIRDFALENLSWTKQLSPIFESIGEHE